MENLILEATTATPKVEFYETGKLYITGKSLPEDPMKFFKPLTSFILNVQSEDVLFTIDLEYFNTSSSKHVMEMIVALNENINVKHKKIIWRYEEGDEDNFEMGKVYEETANNCEFDFHVYAEVF